MTEPAIETWRLQRPGKRDGVEVLIDTDTVCVGVLSDAILDMPLEIALGKHVEDKFWRNRKFTVETLIDHLAVFEYGSKDGLCIVQGSLAGPRRSAPNALAQCILMVDYDTGATFEEVAALVQARGLFAILWTTHSHLKPETSVPEAKLLNFMRQNGLSGAITEEIGIRYLREGARIRPALLEGAKLVERAHGDGGIHFRFTHHPIPKLRALFVLDKPFVFADRGGSQKAAIEEWKHVYAGFCTGLGHPFDTSCTDPSRLMYTPRIARGTPKGTGQAEIRVIAGGLVDLATVPRISNRGEVIEPAPAYTQRVDDEISAFEQHHADRDISTQGGSRAEFKTANLRTFLKLAANDFEAADWMAALGTQERHQHNDGMDCECPNASGHTKQDDKDRAFSVRNASGNTTGGGFGMWCLHEGCQILYDRDRARYLDDLCVIHKVDDAMSLICEQFTPNVWREQQQAQKRQAAAQAVVAVPGALDAMIAALTPTTKPADLQPVILALTKVTDPFERDDHIDAIVDKTKRGVASINKAIKRAEDAAAKDARSAALVTGTPTPVGPAAPLHNVPERLEDARWIWMDWGSATVKRAAAARLAHINKKTPTLFLREEGGVVRIEHINKKARIEEMDTSMWTAETIGLTFMKTLDTGEVLDITAPDWVLKHLQGMSDKQFPVLDRIVQVPVFGPDGQLHTARGYDHTLQVYLDPSCKIEPLPDVIRPADVDRAVDMLDEAIRDFPFSDTMDGSDPLPVKLDEVDGDGFPLPNMDRGVSSRANCMAMILQPFIRNMIKGSTPGYHIDKAAAGTGAGYLVDVCAIIAEGRRAVASPLSENREEVKKVITSNLRSGAQIIFADNINHKVDSGPLAAALTSGTWSDRILGVSEVTTIPMKAMWIFAGNNVEFTHELMRRMVPIRLDAAVARPAQDRGGKDFKHFPLQDWLLTNRDALVRACHIIVAYWVQGGMLPGTGKMLSFDHYARVMSGILETAGVTGFLGNIDSYLTSRDEEQSGIALFIQKIWKEFGEHGATAAELLEAAKDPVTQAIGYGLPVGNDPREHVQVTLFGKYLSKLVGKTFNVEVKAVIQGKTTPPPGTLPGGVILKMKLVKNATGGLSKYRLLPISSLKE